MTTAYITHDDCLRHEMGAGHPESPSRLNAINEHMRSSGMLDELRCLEAPLADADDLTRRAAAAEPENAEAFHMLGIIAHQSGKTAEAIEHLRRAVAIKPDVALYHANLGEMCRLAGRTDEAIAAGRRAIEINPAAAPRSGKTERCRCHHRHD